MLTHLEKQILKLALSVPEDNFYSTEAAEKAMPFVSEQDICGACQRLLEFGYLDECLKIGNGLQRLIHVSYKGRHRYAMAWSELKTFLLRSVLVPIAVSVITSLITLWLRYR